MKQLLKEFKNMDHSILCLIKQGVNYSFILSIISSIILLIYDYILQKPLVYYIGLSLFKTSIFFMVGFIICGFAFQRISKELK